MATETNKKPIIFKFAYRGQQYELSTLTSEDTLGDLRAVICSMLNIEDFTRITLKTLQPTKVIDATDNEKRLAEVFQQSRERIVVEDVPITPVDLSSYQTIQPTREVQPIQLADSTDPEPVCSSTGYLLRHPVPSNNSCLFISVHFCLTNGFVDDQIGKSMRKIIADTVASDKEKYDDAFLGKSNSEYCQWILDDNNWGGAIELSILCKYYETEIVAIDVKNKILNRFGEDSLYQQRMLLLYDGLHYDPLKFQPFDENKPIQTLFPIENTEVLTLADEIAKELNQSHQYTNLKTMAMICSVCNIHLDAKSISEHVAQTGHESFREIAQ